MSTDTAARNADPAVRPFHTGIAEDAIADLQRRVAAWRPPEREPVDDQSQGVQLAALQDLANHWATQYDWRRCEAKLNALPQFTTEIDGLAIHFIHVKSPHEGALTARRGGYGSQAPRWLPWRTLRRPLTWYWRLRGKMGGPGLV